jgi:GNAT superfamily N-acetyltransferase
MVEVTRATVSDRERLADSLASAFADDPVFGWILAGRSRLEPRLRRYFRALLREELRPADHDVYVAADGSGGAIWKPVDDWKTPIRTIVREAPVLATVFELTTGRALRVLSAMERVHPDAPHYYLHTVGTRRADQGTGVGAAVLAPMLGRCDREGVPAYLESSNPRNVAFYARHGFETQGVVPLPEGAPPITRMWREPRR